MKDQLSDLNAPSDAELISRVRGGDVAAYGVLFSRHVTAANRLGRHLTRGPDVDDLVSEAFAKVLQVLTNGRGPDVAFRAYLLTCVRRLHVDRIRATSRLHSSDDMTQFDPGIPFHDTAVATFESGAAAKAFASLPERWQLVLWHLEVEGQKPAEIAPLLGMSANSVSALAHRAREGLRQAFLTMHLSDISDEECLWVTEHLGSYVRKGLSRRDTAKVLDHLDECRRCTAMYLELTEVNSNLAGIIAPLILGAAATGYLASSGQVGVTGLFALAGGLRDAVVAHAGVATAGAVAAGVVTAVTAGILIGQSDNQDVASAADRPITATESTSPSTAPPDVPNSRSPESRATKSPRTSPPAKRDAVAPVADLASPTTSSPATTTRLGAAASGTPPAGASTARLSLLNSTATSSSPSLSQTTSSAPPSLSQSPTTTTPPPTTPPPTTPPPTTPPPTTPPPTTPPPTTPPPTTPPPTTPPADLHIRATVDPDGLLTVSVDGIPPALVTLGIDLESQQTTFVGPTADCSTVTQRHAECEPTLAPLGTGLAGVRMDAPESYEVVLPLTFPTGMVSDELEVTVTATGHEETNPVDNTSGTFTFTPKPREADFAIGALQQVDYDDITDDSLDEYHLSSHITGVPDDLDELSLDLDELSLDLDDKARFGKPTGQGDVDCDQASATRVTCTDLTGALDIDFVVYLAEGTTETVTITLAVPDHYTDPQPGNNTASAELVPPPVEPQFDVVLDSLGVVLDHTPITQVRARVSGVPASVTEVRFQLSGQTKARFIGGHDGATGEGAVDCQVISDTVATCTPVRAGFYADIDVFHPPGQPPETVTVTVVAVGVDENGRTGNNSRDVTIGRHLAPASLR